MCRDVEGGRNLDFMHAIHRLGGSSQRLGECLVLALCRVAQLQSESDLAALQFETLDALAGYEILAGIGIDDALQSAHDFLFCNCHC